MISIEKFNPLTMLFQPWIDFVNEADDDLSKYGP